MNRSPLPGETVLSHWGSLTLSTHRVWNVTGDSNAQTLTSIRLEAVSWISIRREQQPLWLGVALLAVVGGVLAMLAQSPPEPGMLVVAGLVALVCVLVYLAGRKHTLVVAAGSGAITSTIATGSTAAQDAARFLDALEHQVGVVREHASARR